MPLNKITFKYVKTLTFDQGSEFTDCHIVERQAGGSVYYAQASSPWQRGTNENTNRRIRRFIPQNARVQDMSDS